MNATPNGHARTVLVVEDEPIVALELQSHLEHLGFRVAAHVTSGEAAVEAARALRPDLVLMDVRLDGPMDGIEAARTLRAERDVPVVFLTAFGDEATVERAKAAGPFGYLLKPFEERDLHATLAVALDQHRAAHRLRRDRDDLLQILDGLDLGTAMTDEAGRLVFLSHAAARLLGAAADDAIGRPWADALPFPVAALDALRRQAALPPEARERVAVEATSPEGRRFHAVVEVQDDPRTAAPGGGPGGARRHILVFYDLTEVHALRRQLHERERFHELVGRSAPMQVVFRQIEAVARVDTTVLIEGETGTGKELVAQAIHDLSPRRERPFVAVNCAALTETLAASQLFGHTKGAFTGAVADAKGFFGAADGGTLFLDEIGDVPLDVQVTLLRVLEQRQVTRVGETAPRPVDVRIVAASHRNLPRLVEAGRFRADLLYRIRVARVELPALRERPGDLPLLVRRFLDDGRARLGVAASEVSHDAMRALLDYDWPGNVRELKNAVEYALIRAEGPVVHVEDLPPEVRAAGAPPVPAVAAAATERDRILAALTHTGGNRKEAAAVLGVSRATFYRRLAEYGIE
jgi:PAS domain S-box-containing protein